MDISKVSSLLKGNRASRRQDAAPDHKVEFLFVQSFQGGAITAKDDAAGTYTVTFEGGLGQTLFFSDRPDRLVGTAPTAQFLDGIGFAHDNPPNAAVVFQAEEGVDIAVVELTNPVYDEASASATYDLKVLENFDNFDAEFHGTAADLAAIVSPFGSAHLFIDDCRDQQVWCRRLDHAGIHYEVTDPYLGVHGMCWDWEQAYCYPCPDMKLVFECFDNHADYCQPECIVWT